MSIIESIDDYITEFRARRMYAPETVVSLMADFGVPDITENAVRQMVESGRVSLRNFDNLKLCKIGQLIKTIENSVKPCTSSINLIKMVLGLKDCVIAQEFLKRLRMAEILLSGILNQQTEVQEEPQEVQEDSIIKTESKAEKVVKVAKEPKVAKVSKAGKVKLKSEIAKPDILKKKSIPKVVKDLAWNKWVGEDVARTRCLCCGVNEIKMSSFHCGHVMAEANGGSMTVDNLRPICAACNLSMKTENLEDFKKRCGFN
jgi:hypothetical protein